MNKSEIIRKISKKAGVPDTEAKKFFEIFLMNASNLLKPGESLKIPGVGLFQLRVGQIENRTLQQAGDNFIYSDIVVFINQESDEKTETEEEIIFNVPSGIQEVSQTVDSYFSISVGKPIIPLKGVVDSEFFIPPSGSELNSLLDSKMERLLEEAEKVEGGKGTETIHFQTDEEASAEPAERKRTDAEDKAEEIEVPLRSDFLKTREFENLSWDFGETLSHEIEEESVPDAGEEKEETDNERESYINLSEKDAEEQTETEPVFEEEPLDEEAPDENIFEEIIEEETEEVIFEETAGEVTDTERESDKEERKDEIPEISAGKEKIREIEISESQDTGEDQDITSREPEAEEPSLKNFQRVRSLTKEFKSSEFNATGEIEEEIPKKITEVRGGYQKVRRTTAEFDFDLSGIKGLDEIEEPPAEKKKSTHREYQGYRKQSRVPSLVVAFVVVIALGIVIFLYLKMRDANHETSVVDSSAAAKQQTTVIERDYDVPVTYPYEKTGQKSASDSMANLNDQAGAGDKGNTTNAETSVQENRADLSEIRNPVNAERIGTYIYQYPEGIVVQVSSWKNRVIAVSEVKKYRNAGYTAFAEMSDVPGRGLYYRVRVGYFKTLREAENFVNGNK